MVLPSFIILKSSPIINFMFSTLIIYHLCFILFSILTYEMIPRLVYSISNAMLYMYSYPLTACEPHGHMTADEMDEQRKQNIAYEYLCHLEESKV